MYIVSKKIEDPVLHGFIHELEIQSQYPNPKKKQQCEMRTMRIVGYLLASIVAAGSVVASNNATSRVMVHIPFKLHNPEGEEHVQAEFGFQQSSGSISTYVYFIDRPLCNAFVYNRTQVYPLHTEGWKTPFILMANGANCSAVTKARHAQLAGAAALVTADEQCRCSDKDCTNMFGPGCRSSDPALVNDGSGSDVSIPSFLLFKTVAERVKEQLKNNQTVLMELTWGLKEDVESSDQPVYYHLWTTAHDPILDIETYVNLRTVAVAFKDKAHFAPRFSLLDGSRFRCNEEADTNGPCDHLCTNHGRYCAVHARDLSGYAIVKETLRRLCIWKHYGDLPNNDPMVYWDYVIFHRTNCQVSTQYGDSRCLAKSFAHAKIEEKVIDQCMSDAGDLDQDVPNNMLDDMLLKQERSGVVSLPAITVNQKVLDHASSYRLFETICMHYWLSNSPSVPDVCETCGSCPNKIGCLEQGHCVPFSNKGQQKKKTNHGWRTPFFFLFALAIGGGVCVYYKQRDEFNYRVGRLNGYMQLGGEA